MLSVERQPRPRARTPSVAATTCAIDSASSAAASSQNHAPSGKRGSTSAATWIASRVLPTPPTPVRVTSARRSAAPSRSRASSSSRPTNDVSCSGQVAGKRVERAQRRELARQIRVRRAGTRAPAGRGRADGARRGRRARRPRRGRRGPAPRSTCETHDLPAVRHAISRAARFTPSRGAAGPHQREDAPVEHGAELRAYALVTARSVPPDTTSRTPRPGRRAGPSGRRGARAVHWIRSTSSRRSPPGARRGAPRPPRDPTVATTTPTTRASAPGVLGSRAARERDRPLGALARVVVPTEECEVGADRGEERTLDVRRVIGEREHDPPRSTRGLRLDGRP